MNETEYRIEAWEDEDDCGRSRGWEWEISGSDKDPFASCAIGVRYDTEHNARQAANNHAEIHHYKVKK